MQLKTSKCMSSHKRCRDAYNLEEYVSIDDPTVFLGLYTQRDIKSARKHRGKKIIIFGGTDTTYKDNLECIKNDDEFKNAVFISRSEWINRDLDDAGIKYEKMSLFWGDVDKWNPEPLGKSLYWYGGNTTKYGKRYLGAVRQAFPDLDIIILDHRRVVSHKDMSEIYKKCFANLRVVEHDAFSQGVYEMGLMGRVSIYNGASTFSEPYKNIDDIIRLIAKLRNGYNYKLIARRCKSFHRKNRIKWTNLILRLFGTKELDAASIFNESIGRCGSIFRIMRRNVVESMPDKFGTDQFERPYISEQLKKLGLKELITSKDSGFIVSEWKGINNKGYAPGFKDFNTYDKKYG